MLIMSANGHCGTVCMVKGGGAVTNCGNFKSPQPFLIKEYTRSGYSYKRTVQTMIIDDVVRSLEGSGLKETQ